MKRIFTLLLALVIVLSLPLQANAATTNDTEYFRLIPSRERLNADGTFNFYFHEYIFSDHNFITTSSRITLEVSARVYNNSTKTYRNDSSVSFTVFLYKEGIEDYVGYVRHYANGTTKSVSFPVSTGGEYYFKIVAGALSSDEYLSGSGDLSNIYII